MTQLTIDQAMQLAVQNHQAGRLTEAEDIYRRVLAQQPNHPDALHMLGVVARQSGRSDAAIELIQKAIAIKPTVADYYNNLSVALTERHLFDEAVSALRQAIRLKPDLAGAHYNLGFVLGEMGLFDEAISALRQAIQINPGYAEAYNNLGNLLREKGQLNEAMEVLVKATQHRSDFAEAHNNLGNVLRDKGLLDDAIAAHKQALRIKPDYADAYNNLGNALGDAARFDEAVVSLYQAIGLRPDLAEAHFNLANIFLLQGDFARGWSAYEWRMRCTKPRAKRREFVQPQWDGSALNGRTLLLHAEQGFGDTIQLIRYVNSAAVRGGKIVIECQPELIRLFQSLSGVEQVVAQNQLLPHFDVHCPMFSLPLALKTNLETIPAIVPYLKTDEDLTSKWAARVTPHEGRKVGIVWAGSPVHKNDRKRSLLLSQLAPLARASGITFYSLQQGDAARQASTPPNGMKLIDHSAQLTDFAETAALIANLDLVIAADTAVAHLQAGLGSAATRSGLAMDVGTSG
jgi:tetratricopeptide (TPR) repeat protein